MCEESEQSEKHGGATHNINQITWQKSSDHKPLENSPFTKSAKKQNGILGREKEKECLGVAEKK